ncbi:hypothetical protein BDZ89DRAFT_1147531 [Hymenopellis radicata]|nr:hypothetical protein BDZ89DRAFT_1147531 [Hymenopellis radicata]
MMKSSKTSLRRAQCQYLPDPKAQFGIPENHWNQLEWIDEKKAEKDRWKLTAANVKHAGQCRVGLISFLVESHAVLSAVSSTMSSSSIMAAAQPAFNF